MKKEAIKSIKQLKKGVWDFMLFKKNLNGIMAYKALLTSDNFDRVARYWEGFDSVYKSVHETCLNFIEKNIPEYSNVLDVGCGVGNFLGLLQAKKKNGSFSGIDESEEMIKIAREKFPETNFLKGNAEQLPFKEEYFDLIVTIDAIYYFRNKDNFFAEASRVLKKGGYFFINTPSIEHLPSRILLKLSRILKIERNSGHISSKEIFKKAEQNNFNFVCADTMKWPKTPFKYWMIVLIKK